MLNISKQIKNLLTVVAFLGLVSAQSVVTFDLDAGCVDGDATSVRMTGSWWGWDPNGGPEAADNGDGTWSVTMDPAPTDTWNIYG